MTQTIARTNFYANFHTALAQMAAVAAFILLLAAALYAQSPNITQQDENTLIIEESQGEIYSFGKNVIVKGNAKGVLVFGGSAVIEGAVDGDVAVIGGSIIQKETASISGDVIVFGGAYHPESKTPLRNQEKETIVFAVFEEELRHLAQNPSRLFSPELSLGFLAQRVLLLLFWFIISLGLTTIAPGAVSRAVARFQLSALKVFAFGSVGFVLAVIAAMSSVSFLPNYVYTIVIFMTLALLLVSFVFGRVALQVSIGKQIQKRFLPETKQSETLALLLGAFFWTALLSIPYVWIFALLVLTAASLGLVLTARSTNGWQKT